MRYLYSIEVESNKLEKDAYFTVSQTEHIRALKGVWMKSEIAHDLYS